jgi:hypothetical protein
LLQTCNRFIMPYLASLAVLALLIAAAALGGPLFLLGVLLLAAVALLVLLRQFNLLGYQPAVGAAVVISLYLILSGQQLPDAVLAGAPLQSGVVLAALVVVTLVLRLSEHDTRRAVLNWTLTIGGALYLGLLLSYLLRLYNLHPDLADAGEAGPPTLLTASYAQLRGYGLPALAQTIGWPITPPPTPAPSPAAQWLTVGLLAVTLLYFAALRPLARRWAFAPLIGSMVIFALGWLAGGAIAVLLGFALLALNLASATQPLIVAADKLTGGWLLVLAHHLALLAPIVYYMVIWWP